MTMTMYRCHYCGNLGAPYVMELARAEFGKLQRFNVCGRTESQAEPDNVGKFVPSETTRGGCLGRAMSDGYRKAGVITR